MERKALFRAKHVKDDSIFSDEWIYGDLIHYSDGTMLIRQPETSSEFFVEQNTVCQFIGMHDKYHCEIFEKDALELGDKKSTRGVVEPHYNEPSFVLNVVDRASFYDLYRSSAQKYRVIGNTIDNPELLIQNTP